MTGRRFLISIGVGTHHDEGMVDLPGARTDAQRVRALLEPMGYETVLTHLMTDPTSTDIREAIDDWTDQADLGGADVVVVYFAGHGHKAPDQHYLLCADTKPDRYTSRAVAAIDLARPLMYSPVGHLLVMLDTCYAGAGAGDIAVLAAELASYQRNQAGRWMLAAARGKEQAREHAFVDALSDAFRHPRAGAYPEFLGVREVTERVNVYLRAKHPGQHARLSTIDSDGRAPFFPNPTHIRDLPADDLDLATLTRLRRQTRGHFDPRARGLDHLGQRGDYFTGRTTALTKLATWLKAERHDRKARVITGDPGSGKSAFVGRLLMLADPDHPARDSTPASALPPPGLPVVPLHARRTNLERLTADLATALNLPEGDVDSVLAALSERTEPLLLIVDALDEAGTAGDSREGARIARELLQPLTSLPALRLVVGTRRPLIPALGHAVTVLDMDDAQHVTHEDVTAFARAVLLDAADPDSVSPYRDRPEQAETVARGIATRAGTCYLVARMTARALVHGQTLIDTTIPGWEKALPSDAAQAFAAYLARFGPDQPKVERLLRPLAYAQGAGLPWSAVWARVASAISGVPCPEDDIRWLHEHAGAYVVETPTPDGSVYRLFHETMAEHLRVRDRDTDTHRAITEALVSLVPDNPRDWTTAHPYIRDHLATHAAAGSLDPLLNDADYLTHANPAHLAPALNTATSTEARLRSAIYRTSAHAFPRSTPRQRADILAIDATRYGHRDLAEDLTRDRHWRPRWATGSLVHPALRNTLTGHTNWVNAVACVTINGVPHAVTTSHDITIRVWNLEDGTQHAALTGHTNAVTAVACTTLKGRPHAITGSHDYTARVWNLEDSTQRATLTGHTNAVTSVACTVIGDQPHAVTTSNDKTVRLWHLEDGTQRAVLNGHTDWVNAVACTTINGVPHAVTTSHDHTVRVWNLGEGVRRAVLTGHTDAVTAVACAAIDGIPHAVTTGHDHTVRVWDLKAGTQRAVLTGHTDAVTSVACTTIDGVPHAITTSNDHTVRVWDLKDGTQRAVLTGHTSWVNAVACTTIRDHPHAITTSDDHTARVWNLEDGTQHAVLTGHTNWVNAVACTTIRDHPHAITTSDDHTARVWDLKAGTQHAVLTGHTDAVTSVACTTIDGIPHAVTTSNDHTVRVWNLKDGTQRAVLTGHTNWVNAVACTTIDGVPHAITTSDDHTARVWNLEEEALRTILSGHDDAVTSVVGTTLDGRPHAITTSNDQTVRVWNLEDGTEHTTLRGHNDWVNAVAHTTVNGRPHAITTSNDHTVRVWNLEDGTEHTTLRGHNDWVNAVAHTTVNGRPHAITTSDDHTTRVWDLAVHQLVDTITLPLPGHAVATCGPYIVIGMYNEVVVLVCVEEARPDR